MMRRLISLLPSKRSVRLSAERTELKKGADRSRRPWFKIRVAAIFGAWTWSLTSLPPGRFNPRTHDGQKSRQASAQGAVIGLFERCVLENEGPYSSKVDAVIALVPF